MTSRQFVPVNEPLLDGNEEKYLVECIRSGWISSEGPFVEQFESQFSARVGRRHGVAVANGSLALDAAVVALGIGPGDEVIMPTFTIISCAAAVVRAGAIPVLVDADPVTWNMVAGDVEPRITPRTRAIMVAHMYGLPVEMDSILAIAKKHDLRVIEDAAGDARPDLPRPALRQFRGSQCLQLLSQQACDDRRGGNDRDRRSGTA
jgi:perosamine synthetase